MLKDRGPADVKLCTLLDKPDRRVVEVKVDYTGFEIPDEFVVLGAAFQRDLQSSGIRILIRTDLDDRDLIILQMIDNTAICLISVW